MAGTRAEQRQWKKGTSVAEEDADSGTCEGACDCDPLGVGTFCLGLELSLEVEPGRSRSRGGRRHLPHVLSLGPIVLAVLIAVVDAAPRRDEHVVHIVVVNRHAGVFDVVVLHALGRRSH